MHGHISPEQFLEEISGFLGTYYLLLAVMNAIAAFYCWNRLKRSGLAVLWLTFALLFVVISPLAFSGSRAVMEYISMPEAFREFVDKRMANAVTYSVGTLVALAALFVCRRFFAKPVVAWIGLNLSLLLMGLSMTDQEFAAIVTKPDNVPIVAMVFLLGFFTWLATNRAVEK